MMLKQMARFKTADGAEFDLPLEYLEVKDCVFVPTLKADATRILVCQLADKLKIKVNIKTAIEDGYLGVIIWRVG
jgi:hypothetical protein